MRYATLVLLVTITIGCESRSSSYPPAQTPEEALRATIHAMQDDNQEAFFAYSSPVKMTADSRRKMFNTLQNVAEFQAAFDEHFGAERWSELMETRGSSGGKINLSRIPSDFTWFQENSIEVSPEEIHVTIPGDSDATVIRKLDDASGWTVDILKAQFQNPNVDMNQTADVLSTMLSTIPDATQAIEDGETDFGTLADICAEGLKKMFSMKAVPSS